MTVRTQGDQIFRRVVPELASRLKVVDLQMDGATALLATPPISHQHLAMKLRVGRTLESNPWTLLAQFTHADFLSWDEKVCCSDFGKSS
jgi:hypothetical protein